MSPYNTYQTNYNFAEQRLSGLNLVVLRSVDRLSDYLQPAEIAEITAEFENSLDLTDNLYVADYTELLSIASGTFGRGRTYLPRPVALFSWRSSGYGDRGQLVLIAIKLDVALNDRTLITAKDDSLDWLYAKTCVQIADSNYHELISHLSSHTDRPAKCVQRRGNHWDY